MPSFVIESEPPDWQSVGHEHGETPSEALKRFCKSQGISDGEFRLRDHDRPAADWTYVTMIEGMPVDTS